MLMKFFRKHNKKLLAFFMVILMVVFIGGSALQGLLTPRSNRVVATSKFGDISFLDQEIVRSQTELLDLLGMDWRRPIPGGVDKPLEEVDWLLLLREADQLGATSSLAELRVSAEADQTIDQVEQVARRLRAKPERIQLAMAEYRSVQNAVLAVASAAAPSEAELRRAARDALEQVRIRAVVLPAQAFIDNQTSFSEEQLEAQLAQHREKEPGRGLDFGYYVQPALKVQYVKINRDAIIETIGIANLDKKAREYYEKNRSTNLSFRKKPEDLIVSDPAAEGVIVGPPAPPPSPYLEWEEAEHIAVAALRQEHADEAAERIADWAIQYEAASWLDAARGEDGYRQPPANVATVDFYAQMLERIPVSLRFPDAVSTATTEFFVLEDADELPELGTAAFSPERGARQSFHSLLSRTKALVPVIPKTESASASEYLASFQTCPYPLRDPKTGNRYVFRVIESIPGHPAESLDEVRERVVADLRLLAGYEAAKEKAHSLQECAESESLREAYDADGQLAELVASGEGEKGGFFEPPPFARLQRNQAARGRSEDGVLLGAGVGKVSNKVVDTFFALADAEGKLVVLELPERATVLVAEWVETLRADEDEFTELRRKLSTELAFTRQRAAINEWLDPERIRARGGLTWVTR